MLLLCISQYNRIEAEEGEGEADYIFVVMLVVSLTLSLYLLLRRLSHFLATDADAFVALCWPSITSAAANAAAVIQCSLLFLLLRISSSHLSLIPNGTGCVYEPRVYE